jgi:hypothetical protein
MVTVVNARRGIVLSLVIATKGAARHQPFTCGDLSPP